MILKIDVNHNVTSVNVTNRSLRRKRSTHENIVSRGGQRKIDLNCRRPSLFKTTIIINNWSHTGSTVSTFSLEMGQMNSSWSGVRIDLSTVCYDRCQH